MEGNLEALKMLEDGMYVRTEENGIDKFIFKIKEEGKPYYTYYFEKAIITNPEYYIIGEPSFNPINLIQAGDFVNGVEVIGKLDYLLEFDGGQDGNYYLRDDEIKSIVTKEQFSQMEYEVK